MLRFFESKEDVFLAVMERASASFVQRIEAALAALPESADAVVRLMAICREVFARYDEDPGKVALIFSENGLSIRMLRGSEGQAMMTLPGMTRLVELMTEQFVRGRKERTFAGIDPVAAREVFFGMLEGTIWGWLLSSDPQAKYRSAPAKKILVVIEQMLGGLRPGRSG